jgi:hypothetical protein
VQKITRQLLTDIGVFGCDGKLDQYHQNSIHHPSVGAEGALVFHYWWVFVLSYGVCLLACQFGAHQRHRQVEQGHFIYAKVMQLAQCNSRAIVFLMKTCIGMAL